MLSSRRCPSPHSTSSPRVPGLSRPFPDARPSTRAPLHAEQRPFDAIPRSTWDRLADLSPWATPFSAWAFHRAWWDGYGPNAHEEILVVCRGDATTDPEPVAIVPLMHRHEVEPTDAETQTTIRPGAGLRLTPVSPTATAILFAASYHADYATVLADPADLPAVAEAVADYVASAESGDWDVVDLRRLRCADPTGVALAAAFGTREVANGWTLNVDREDVCPVVTFPEGVDMDGLPRDARQEAAPRDPPQGPAGRGQRCRSGWSIRPTRWPTSRSSSTSTSDAGAPTGCSRRPPAASRAG